jgi:hypothetical protein
MIDKKFKPTEQMINLLRAMLDVDVKPTITAFCENAGISRETYYNWFENEDFGDFLVRKVVYLYGNRRQF